MFSIALINLVDGRSIESDSIAKSLTQEQFATLRSLTERLENTIKQCIS